MHRDAWMHYAVVNTAGGTVPAPNRGTQYISSRTSTASMLIRKKRSRIGLPSVPSPVNTCCMDQLSRGPGTSLRARPICKISYFIFVYGNNNGTSGA